MSDSAESKRHALEILSESQVYRDYERAFTQGTRRSKGVKAYYRQWSGHVTERDPAGKVVSIVSFDPFHGFHAIPGVFVGRQAAQKMRSFSEQMRSPVPIVWLDIHREWEDPAPQNKPTNNEPKVWK